MLVNIQFFGGRGSGGSSASRGGGGGGGSSQSLSSIDRQISRASFSNEGRGSYEMDIRGVGGGQVLDETGSSRDLAYGRGGKVYSVRTWDANYNMIGAVQYVGSLNDGKSLVRDTLRSHYGVRR